jgi:hypothetical protein
VEAEASTEEEDSTAAALAAATLLMAADVPSAVIMAVDTTAEVVVSAGEVVMVGVAATAGAAEIGAIHVTEGAGDGVLDLGGRIGVGAGDTRMGMATVLGITLPTIHTLTLISIQRMARTMVLLTLRIPATRLPRQIRTLGHSPTGTDRRDPGNLLCRETPPAETTRIGTSHRVVRFCPLTE